MASKSKLEDLNLSRDEVKRLGEALKDEKFREMLLEYAEEISDPENRRRYEDEIAQMESERGMDVTFIRPEPGYVLKTSINGERKAFINISKNDNIDKPSSERKRNDDGKSGLLWHIPHSFAPPREDYDKEKNRCQVYDFVIHPDTYRMAESNDRFKKLVEDTAMDGIEKQFDVTLDRKNVKRPNLKFKGTPSATVVRNRNPGGPQPAPDASSLLKDMPYPYENKTTHEKMTEREESKASDKETRRKGTSAASSKVEKKNQESDTTVPKYTMVHRSEIDMQEYRNAPDAKPSTRPRELVIKIELPLLKSAAEANLEIFEKRLFLESKTPSAYKLDLSLPYPVDDSEGSAKFDKQKRTLTVTLPVIPEKAPSLPSFVNGTNSSLSEEEAPTEKPLIEVLPDNSVRDTRTPQENSTTSENRESVTTNGVVDNTFSPQVSYTLPDFSFTQDTETVSYVLKVKNIAEHSIKRTSPSGNEVKLVCTSKGEGGFPQHYSLFLRFPETCQVVPEHCSVDVTADNIVLLLLKERQSRGLWDHFWAGLDSDSLEERLFLTTSNLQQQLTELDEAAVAVEQMTTSPDAAAHNGTSSSSCDLEVTAMNDKKLTIKILRPKKNESKKQMEEEDDEYDAPSSAEIEVVHTNPSPSLHGILKQRTISESSEDYNPDPESPRSPVEDEDELSSSFNSSGKRRSVSFSKHIDKATFKSSASVNSMKTSLKSKRKRQRKWEEKNEKVSSRRRHNSGGSEGSGDDHTHSLSDSHSLSEEEHLAEDEQKGQGDQKEDCDAVCARLETELDFRTKPSDGKSTGSSETDPSKINSSLPDESSKSNVREKNVPEPQNIDAASAHEDAADESSSTDKLEDSSGKKDSIAAKVKSKLAETTPEDCPDDSDDENEQKDDEMGSSGQGANNPSDAVNNEHRTECAFNFSNEVMFDLDDE